MIEISVPSGPLLELRHALLDFNGTLACDGRLLDGVAERLRALSTRLEVHIATGNTTGTAPASLAGLPVDLSLMPAERQSEAKWTLMQTLGAAHVVAIGNGRNDRDILEHAALSIAVIGREGCAVETLAVADIVCTDIRDALDTLMTPSRLIATLRG